MWRMKYRAARVMAAANLAPSRRLPMQVLYRQLLVPLFVESPTPTEQL